MSTMIDSETIIMTNEVTMVGSVDDSDDNENVYAYRA